MRTTPASTCIDASINHSPGFRMNPLATVALKYALGRVVKSTRGKKKKMLVKGATWAADRVVSRNRRAVVGLAFKGLGAAAIAIPIGFWLGKKVLR